MCPSGAPSAAVLHEAATAAPFTIWNVLQLVSAIDASRMCAGHCLKSFNLEPGRDTLSRLVQAVYLESEFGVLTDLEAAGSALENPYVYDSAARELKSMADKGLVKIIRERVRHGAEEPLIGHISFTRLR
jgi:hypothetical protein